MYYNDQSDSRLQCPGFRKLGLQEAKNQKVIEMPVPILSGCLDFRGRSEAMLSKYGRNSPKGYTTNDAKPWAWKSHHFATHEKMKTKRDYGVTWRKHNTLYILSTVLIKS